MLVDTNGDRFTVNFFKKSLVIWALFLSAVAVLVMMLLCNPAIGGVPLDSLATVTEVKAQLLAMTASERSAHFIMTLVLDTLFPLTYAGFFAATTLRYFKRCPRLLALPALLVIPVDLLENTTQLFALSGNESLLPIKAVVTPVKYGLFFVAATISVSGLASGVVRRLRHSD